MGKQMTKPQIAQALDEAGIEIPTNATKAAMLSLLENAPDGTPFNPREYAKGIRAVVGDSMTDDGNGNQVQVEHTWSLDQVADKMLSVAMLRFQAELEAGTLSGAFASLAKQAQTEEIRRHLEAGTIASQVLVELEGRVKKLQEAPDDSGNVMGKAKRTQLNKTLAVYKSTFLRAIKGGIKLDQPYKVHKIQNKTRGKPEEGKVATTETLIPDSLDSLRKVLKEHDPDPEKRYVVRETAPGVPEFVKNETAEALDHYEGATDETRKALDSLYAKIRDQKDLELVRPHLEAAMAALAKAHKNTAQGQAS